MIKTTKIDKNGWIEAIFPQKLHTVIVLNNISSINYTKNVKIFMDRIVPDAALNISLIIVTLHVL